MPQVKSKRHSTFVDMTAMCDVAFLLLTFFILTSKFRPQDPVQIDMPASVSERKIQDSDIMIASVDKEGRIFWGTDNQTVRERTLALMSAEYKIGFTEDQIKKFKTVESFGVPMRDLGKILDGTMANDGKTPGIPVDSLDSPNKRNEFADWLYSCRRAHLEYSKEKVEKDGKIFDMKSYEYIRLALKGDGITEYPKVSKIFDTLKDKAINKFDLITNLKGGDAVSKGAATSSGGH